MAEKITIRILNRDYFVDDKGDPLYINALARFVEERMERAGKKDNIVETSRLAVHAALGIADELLKLKENQEKLTGDNAYRVDKMINSLNKVIS